MKGVPRVSLSVARIKYNIKAHNFTLKKKKKGEKYHGTKIFPLWTLLLSFAQEASSLLFISFHFKGNEKQTVL